MLNLAARPLTMSSLSIYPTTLKFEGALKTIDGCVGVTPPGIGFSLFLQPIIANGTISAKHNL
jgi:hypothetical protein